MPRPPMPPRRRRGSNPAIAKFAAALAADLIAHPHLSFNATAPVGSPADKLLPGGFWKRRGARMHRLQAGRLTAPSPTPQPGASTAAARGDEAGDPATPDIE